jgi:hypothetical protein
MPDFVEQMKCRFPRLVKIGKVTGQVRMFGDAYDALREHVWWRDDGRCVECGRRVMLEKGHWRSAQLAHIKSKGSFGSDIPENVRILCLEHHAAEHSGKPIAAIARKPESAFLRGS